MFDKDSLYKVLDSHFVSHLAHPDEAELLDDQEGYELPDMPDNMLDDLLDELDGALEELHDEYGYTSEILTAAAIGFADGVVAQSSGSYTNYEDAYFEDAKNADLAALDGDITAFAEAFEGNRDWGEAAKGYIRHVARPDDDSAARKGVGDGVLLAQAQGFVYGADVCEDYEWKVIQAPDDSILVTDEDAIEEFSFRQLEQSGQGGNLFDRVFNALGIDLGELQQAFGTLEEGDDPEDDEGDEGEAQVHGGNGPE